MKLAVLVAKDLRVLARSPALVAILVLYPLLVAALVAAAVGAGDRRPQLAVVNLDTPGMTVRVGEQRLSVDDYLTRIDRDADTVPMEADAAQHALDNGDVDAVVTIPSGFIAALSSGVQQPRLVLRTNPRNPVEGQAIARRMEAAVFRFNQQLAAGYVAQVVRLSDLIINGGALGVFGRDVDVIGLERSRQILERLRGQASAQGRPDLAGELDQLLTFIRQTQANLNLVRPAAAAIASPIVLETEVTDAGRAPLSAFGVAAALVAALGLIGVLLGASGVAVEREDGTLERLRRARVGLTTIVAAKIVVAAVACLVVGAVLLVTVAVLTDITVAHIAGWPAMLLLAGAGFGAVGAAVGAVVRDTRSALLVSLMCCLPLVFLAVVPHPAARAVAGMVPFGRAFDAFRELLTGQSLGGNVLRDALLVAVMAAVFGAAATVALRRADR